MPRGNRIYKRLKAGFFGVEISELFDSDKGIQISQNFENSTINTAILILTDKAAVDRVLDAIKYTNKK
jgi:hypothetical protein